MRIKKHVRMLAAVFLLAWLSACGGKSVDIPFTSLTLDTTKKDVIAEYGESSDTETATDGGEILHYEHEYQGKDGRLGFSFAPDGKIRTINWIYSPEDKEEFDTLVTAIKSDVAKDFGDPTSSNEARIDWEKGKTAVTLTTVAIEQFGGVYNVRLIYSNGGSSGAAGADTAAADEALSAAVAEYELGDAAQGQKYELTVDSVDATPEYGDFVTTEKDEVFFFASLELTNNGDTAVDVIDVLKFYADDEKCQWVHLFEKYNGVDGLNLTDTVEAGKKIKGYAAVCVPDKWNKVQLVCDDVAFTFTHADLGSISSQNTGDEAPTYTVDDTLTRNGMKITLTDAVQTDYIPENNYFYYEPDAGYHFVITFFDIRNDSEQSQKFNATAVFDPYVDDYSSGFTRLLGTTINGVEALSDNERVDILPGKSLEGYMVMQVPQGWKKIELTTRQGNFEITNKQVTVQ